MQNVRLEDSVLIERAQKGDHGAFDQLIRNHTDRAYQYAYRLTRDSDEASEIVADAFLKVFKGLSRFKGESAFTTWLYRIETNCFLDRQKKKGPKSVLSLDSNLKTEDGELGFQVEDARPSAQEHVEQDERLSAIERALRQLPDYYRSMILMFHAEMLSYEEIAKVTDLPVGTVKSRLNRARASLKERLSPNQLFAGANFRLRSA